VKNPFDSLDKILEHRLRLQIMSVLVANDSYDFNALKELLNVTDGNLASHIKALEKEKYVLVHKTFVDRKPIPVTVLQKREKMHSGNISMRSKR
jgi:DNA-binding MarR family transcriptional regulator